MRDELAHMLVHGSLVRWQPDCEQLLSIFDSLAVECPSPSPSRLHCTDADDQCFIDLALAQRARWLITHDRALLRLARRARALGVEILTPAQWCAGHGVDDRHRGPPLSEAPLPHHPACGSAPGGSRV